MDAEMYQQKRFTQAYGFKGEVCFYMYVTVSFRFT